MEKTKMTPDIEPSCPVCGGICKDCLCNTFKSQPENEEMDDSNFYRLFWKIIACYVVIVVLLCLLFNYLFRMLPIWTGWEWLS